MEKSYCKKCKKSTDKEELICSKCGYKNIICKSCLHNNTNNSVKCYNCGENMQNNGIKLETLIIIICIIIVVGIVFSVLSSNAEKDLNFNHSNEYSESTNDDNNFSNSYSNDDDNKANKYRTPEKWEAKYMAELICKDELLSSSSAKWGKNVNITSLGNDKYSVSGTVTAKNLYGVELTKMYFAYFTFTGEGYKEGYCSILDN